MVISIKYAHILLLWNTSRKSYMSEFCDKLCCKKTHMIWTCC